MGIGTGTGVGGSAVPPQIHESQTTAFVETNKIALAITPADTYEVVPFTQQDSHMFRRYDTKASTPLLSEHLMQMRMSTIERALADKDWIPAYDELLANLPTGVRELLILENDKSFLSRDFKFVALNNLLMATAKFISWIESSTISPSPNTTAAIRNGINMNFSNIALHGAVSSFGSISTILQSQLHELGSNFIGHDHIIHVLSQLDKLLPVFDHLSKKAAAGENVEQEFIVLSDATHQLSELNKKEGAGEFGLLGAVLDTLDIIGASQALESGSSSLLIAAHLANIENKSVLSSIVDKLTDGLQETMGSGLRSQIAELSSLQSDLRALRDG